MASRRPPS
jgi:fructose-bisphosphate aldolase class II